VVGKLRALRVSDPAAKGASLGLARVNANARVVRVSVVARVAVREDSGRPFGY